MLPNARFCSPFSFPLFSSTILLSLFTPLLSFAYPQAPEDRPTVDDILADPCIAPYYSTINPMHLDQEGPGEFTFLFLFNLSIPFPLP